MPYLLDANVFIQAKNLFYGFDFCPAFWDWLIQGYERGLVYSIEKVGQEIKAGDDDLSRWVDDISDGFFLKPDAALLPALATLSAWAGSGQFEPAAVSTFLQVADYFLVGHALAHGYTVVTLEKASTSTKKIKIPDACISVDVKVVTPYQMLRIEKARFVLPEGFAGRCR